MSDVAFSKEDFEPIVTARRRSEITRPSLSYWEDAWLRLQRNGRALASLYLIAAMLAFTIGGPFVWRADPAAQDVNQINQAPFADRTAVIVEPYQPWSGPTSELAASDRMTLALAEPANTQAVRLQWSVDPHAAGYRVYRTTVAPGPERAFGLPLGDVVGDLPSFEDRLNLDAVRYYYTVVALDDRGEETRDAAQLVVVPIRAITAEEAADRGLTDHPASLNVGDVVRLALHPLGTDYLGRDLLARLMSGARVSLFIGIAAPFVYVLIGILYGSAAGFVGGRTDQALMRLAEFVIALPFLLFMILIRIAFGIGPGESGIVPLLVALIMLGWPSSARLVRGQILQIREEGYVNASRLLGAQTQYLILRHMIPNTLGVILVELTFAVPSAIFTEAFLSFIGMGVAPPTASWGSMCNDGVKTMLSHPHELIFPALFISATVLAFNLLGDGLRDALDPRMRSRE
jgi:oligopeptide transport system permease protein